MGRHWGGIGRTEEVLGAMNVDRSKQRMRMQRKGSSIGFGKMSREKEEKKAQGPGA